MLRIKNLTLYLTKDLREIIKDFSFSLNYGQKVALIGEEGNGKSSLLKAIYEPEMIKEYILVNGEIDKKGELLGYLPQNLSKENLDKSTSRFLEENLNWDTFDFDYYYKLLKEFNFSENKISTKLKVRDLSGGEKIKFQLLIEMLKKPTVLLLDEPSNDLDLEGILWFEKFIKNLKLPVIFVCHDETLIENCANTIIHLEYLRKKKIPRHTVVNMGYSQYLIFRGNLINKQKQIAEKEKEEYLKKMERYRRIYQRVQNELRKTKVDSIGKNLKDKMHTVKAMGKRFEKEKEKMTEKPYYDDGILVKFDDGIIIPKRKKVLDLNLEKLEIGDIVLSRNIKLTVLGPQKICIVGKNGCGKTTLIKRVLEELDKKKIPYGYMPQNYYDLIKKNKKVIEFLSKTGDKEENTKIRTYLGSLNFNEEEMFHTLEELSCGQKAKLFFIKMVLDKKEVLILDEPTRNISPFSNSIIREALKNFKGCIIAVSHDRKFINEIFEKILILNNKGLNLISKEKYFNDIFEK